MKPRFIPVKDKLLVRHLPPEKDGAILLPQKLDDRRKGIKELPAILAEVVAVGELKLCRLKLGQRVQLNPYCGTELRLEGVLYTVYNESDLLAVMEE